MSAAAMNARARYTGAVARLQNLAKALEEIAKGEGLRAANERIEAVFRGVAMSKLPKHVATGNALAVVDVHPDAHGIALRQPRYLRYQRKWWPFSRGVPPFLLNRALKIYREELQRLLAKGTQ
jgi:hypothetical protein